MKEFGLVQTLIEYDIEKGFLVEYEFKTSDKKTMKAVVRSQGTTSTGFSDLSIVFVTVDYNKSPIVYNADFFTELEYTAYEDISEYEDELKENPGSWYNDIK